MITPIDATNIIKREMFDFDTNINNYTYYAKMVNTNAVVQSVKVMASSHEPKCISATWVELTKDTLSKNWLVEIALTQHFMNMFNAMRKNKVLNIKHAGKKLVNITSGR